MKALFAIVLAVLVFSTPGCKKIDSPPRQTTKYPADVANAWMQMHIRLTRTTAGYNSVVSDRSIAYAGLTLYESLVPGLSGYRSLLPQIGGAAVALDKSAEEYYWPASANAAMAALTRSFFETASPADMASIDSLEAAFTAQYQSQATSATIQHAVDYGHSVATSIFTWSTTDGAHQAYKHLVDTAYHVPTGDGKWVPTFPAFGPPILPHWGDNRSFISNIAANTQPGPPIAYSATEGSPFFEMVNELYTISLSLSHEDSLIAKFWGDQPGNLNVPAHATNILTQLINKNNFDLASASAAYALHGIAMYDASISVFKTKYTYVQVRPITYIRTVMQHPNWNSVIPTPPHPEYSAAHSVLSGASQTVLEKIFGSHYTFTDHTYDASYGARTFQSFEDYAKEAGRARLLAGLHYSPSIATGLSQGNKVGNLVNQLRVN